LWVWVREMAVRGRGGMVCRYVFLGVLLWLFSLVEALLCHYLTSKLLLLRSTYISSSDPIFQRLVSVVLVFLIHVAMPDIPIEA